MVTVWFELEATVSAGAATYYARLALPFTAASAPQSLKSKIYSETGDMWLAHGGTTPVFYATQAINDFARGDDVNGNRLSGCYTFFT